MRRRSAQTSLREIIGATDFSRLLSDRQAADEQSRGAIAEKTQSWGVAVRSVEIRDVAIPGALQDAMSRQAQAAREKRARVTLAEAEEEIARRVVEAAVVYQQNPIALQLRQMNLLYEMNKERGATVLVPTEMASSLGLIVKRHRKRPLHCLTLIATEVRSLPRAVCYRAQSGSEARCGEADQHVGTGRAPGRGWGPVSDG